MRIRGDKLSLFQFVSCFDFVCNTKRTFDFESWLIQMRIQELNSAIALSIELIESILGFPGKSFERYFRIF